MLTTLLVLVLSASGCDRCSAKDAPESDELATPRVTAELESTQPFGFGGGPWQWATRGIGGGGAFLAAAINPHDPNDMAISTDMGMAFRTVDFGRSWWGWHFATLRGGERATLSWTADPDVLFTIDGHGWRGAFPVRSEDGGREWQRLAGDPTEGEAWWIAADPTTTDRVLLAGWATLYASRDGGQTFNEVYADPEPEGGLYIAGVVWAGERVFVGTGSQLLVSEDGGSTFAPRPYAGLPPTEEVGSLAGATDGDTTRLWIVGRAVGQVWPGIRADQTAHFRGVYALDWAHDAVFAALPGAIQPGFSPFTVAAAGNDIDTVYLAGGRHDTEMPDVLRSRDGGATFVSTFRTRNNENIETGWCGNRGDVDFWWSGAPLTFAISATDSNRLIMGDFGFVHVSADGGASWRQAYVDVEDQNPAGAPTPKGAVYRGIGLEDTSSWWLHWSDASTIIAGYSDIRGIISTDGGEHWTSGISAGLPHNSTYHIVANPQSGRLYAATSTVHDLYQSTYLTDARINGGDGQIVYSDDGGRTWLTLIDMLHPVVWLALDPATPGRMYAAVAHSELGGIWVTDAIDDPTVRWRNLPMPARTQGHPLNVHVLDDGTLVTSWSGRRDSHTELFTTSSGIFVSADRGRTWTDRSHPDMQRWTKDIVIDPHDPTQNTWYVAVFSHWGSDPNELGGIFRTRDRGVTWQRISDLYRVESVTIDPRDPDHMFVTTESNGLWQTRALSSDEPTFSRVLTYPFEHPTRVFFDPHDESRVWATSFGGGLRVWDRDAP